MKKVGFIGAYDKIDLIIYIAKILTRLDKKILVVDNTINQKAKYIVPTINPTKAYITEFENIDIAVGFSKYEQISNYLGNDVLEYDYLFIDIDSSIGIQEFDLINAQKNYFVTSFDNYSLKRGLEILVGTNKILELTKVLYAEEILKVEDDYLNFLALGQKINWNEYRVYFPIENGDISVIHENHRLSKISFKKMSNQFKESLEYLVTDIASEINSSSVKRIIKEL